MRTSFLFLLIAAGAAAAICHYHRQPLTGDTALGLFASTGAAAAASFCAIGAAGDTITRRRALR